mmetsp:Transcript_6179/g.10250  ORF Transcript_6179/g.10250 Transcript_6179/m.10250 type:complete len:120 (+) Transcript_6179:393-752(+)
MASTSSGLSREEALEADVVAIMDALTVSSGRHDGAAVFETRVREALALDPSLTPDEVADTAIARLEGFDHMLSRQGPDATLPASLASMPPIGSAVEVESVPLVMAVKQQSATRLEVTLE